ncbi:hypothetical protein GUITHDRAFT_91255 [Guillardia theta CCMP2712]|uniref:Uncharacterized protein n=1 Tax=Guillardia theta (strain CCMP2712) TaxID=905079 RepID=L1I514_GUITC|nr:hypothetical protein GUITHDRAFT_91255 [Guillardia theta CCMP2712]EKX31187.1 hypothetical protein GUITHDRAFT_91255 [Guillardia theta CCMP2712]|eukprot:XP_005818167.1 hypothetical protein GUITHDRAFT_91255 [Guillardia theta CCMP2712]
MSSSSEVEESSPEGASESDAVESIAPTTSLKRIRTTRRGISGATDSAIFANSDDANKVDLPRLLHMNDFQVSGFRGNPVVIGLSLLGTLILVIIAVAKKDEFFSHTVITKRWITNNFTWLFIGAQNIWVLFIAYIWLIPKYGSMKLGHEDTKPDYNTVTWFMMMFGTAGTGTGLVYYGVGEPILHLGYNRYVARGYLTFDEISQTSINLAYYHWGIHAWMCYTIVGLSTGVAAYRLGLPLTIRSCFFPIFGKMVFGWFGDVVDTLSVFTTLFAICISMGVGAIQINTGLNMLFNVNQSTGVKVILIALMTVLGGISAHAGLRRGVRVLSIISFCVMLSLLFMALLADDTKYLLNLFFQSIGHHIHTFIVLGSHTDAFAQLGISVDKKSGPQIWMDWWTIFYWSWWVSWSPFVGMFIARISKGRTIKEVINASLTGPVLFTMVWFAVFGGAGLRMERLAIRDGCFARCKIVKDNVAFSSDYCSSALYGNSLASSTARVGYFEMVPSTIRNCSDIRQLSTRTIDEMWFDVISQYSNIGNFMIVISLIAMVLSVVTTNDSGSIILNYIGSNGVGGSVWSRSSSGHSGLAS